MRAVREVAREDALNRALNTELSSGFDHSTSQKLMFKVTVIIPNLQQMHSQQSSHPKLTFSNLQEGSSGKERSLFFLR